MRWLISTALALCVMQFGFLYVGMAAGMPSGLASLVLQASAPFTVVIAGVWLHERISRRQLIGIGIAVAGLAAIAVHRAQIAAVLPVILTLCAALGWAIGNVCSRRAAAPKPLHLTLWMSVIPPIPLLALSLVFEGPARIEQSHQHDVHRGGPAGGRSACSTSCWSPPWSATACGTPSSPATRPAWWHRSRCWCRWSACSAPG